MNKLYIISDCHGNIEGLQRSLCKAGITDNQGKRQLARRHQVFSIGDLANCVEDSIEGDKACLDLVGEVIDGMVVGNHEISYFDPSNTFWGFVWDNEINDKLQSLLTADLIGTSVVLDQTLITHAGLTRQLAHTTTIETALQAHHLFEEHWEARNFSYSLFSNVGRARYGQAPFGGILWCDFDKEFIPTDFPQIVGHTPKFVRMKGNALCIDVGAKDPNSNDPFILEIS